MRERLLSTIDRFNDNVVMTLTTKDDGLYILQATAQVDEALKLEIKALKAKWNFCVMMGEYLLTRVKSECRNCGEYFIMQSPYMKDVIEDDDDVITIIFATHDMGREYDCKDCDEEGRAAYELS